MAETVTPDRLSELTVLSRLAERAGEAETAEALLEGALDDVLSLSDDDVALALLVDDDERVLRLAAERHVPAAVATALTTHAPRLDQGVLGEVFASGRLTIVDRRAHDVRVVGPELFGLGVDRLLVLPLRAGGRSVGLIVLGGFGAAAVPGERLPFLEVLGGQLGAFVDAVRQRGGQRASVAAFERLTAVAGQVVRLQDAGQLLSLIVEEAGRMLNADAVGIRKVEGDELVLIAEMDGGRGLAFRPRIKLGESLTGRIARDGHPIAVYDLAVDDRPLRDHAARALAAGFRSFLGVPFVSGGQVTGTLSIYTRERRRFSETEVRLLSAFAEQAAVAIENAKLYAASEKRRRGAEALADISRTQVDSSDHETVARRIVESVAALLGTRMALLYQVAPDSGDLVYLAGVGQPTDLNLRLPCGTGAVGRAVARREPVYAADLLAEPDIVFTPAARAVLERSAYRAVLAVPLIVHGRVIGALAARDERGRIFDEDDARLLHAFAGQAAVALENARLFTESERRRQAAEEIAEIGRILSSSLDPEVVAERIVDSVSRVLRVEMPTLYRHDPVSGGLTVAAGDSGGTSRRVAFPSGVGVVGHALAAREPFTSADVLADPRLEITPEFRAHVEKHGRSAALAVPLITGGEVIGVLLVRDRAGRVFSEEEIGLARAFAAQAAVALKNAEMLHEARTRQARLETLLDVNRQLAVIQPLEVVLQGIAAHCGRLLDSESAGFRLVEGDDLVLSATWGDALETMLKPRLKVGESLSGIVAATGQPLHIADVSQDPRCLPEHREASQALGHHSWLGVPLKVGETVVGVLSVRTRRTDGFGDADVQVATAFAAQAAVAVENARLFRRAEERAERLAALSSVTSLMLSAGDSREIYAAVARAATTLLGGRLTRVWICDAEADVLRLAETYATDPAYTSPGLEMATTPMRRGVLGSVMETLEPQYIPEILDDPRFINRRLATAGEFHSVAAIPLVTGGRGLGALMTFFGERRDFSDEDKALMRLLADQAAIALEKSRLYEDAQTRAARMKRLGELSHLVNSSLDLQEVLDFVTDAARELLRGDIARLCVADANDPDLLRLTAESGGGEVVDVAQNREFRRGVGVAGWILEHKRSYYAPNLLEDPLFTNKAWARAGGCVSMLMAPLLLGDRSIGTLGVMTQVARVFSDDERELLELFAAKAAIAISNARLYATAKTHAARMTRLSELSQLLSSSLDTQRVLDSVTEAARDLVKGDLARLWVLDDKSGMICHAARSGAAGQAEVGMVGEIRAGQGIAGWVIEHKRTYYAANVVEDPLWIEKDWARQAGFVSAIVTPLIVGDRAIGNLTIMSKTMRAFSADERELVELFAAKAATTLENARLYADLRAQATALEAKNAELDSFVYVVSHDLKSPLVAIQGMASMIEADHADRLDERGQRYLKRIGANVDQMERLIGDLLALSRIGREGRAAEPIAVDEVVAEVLLEQAERIHSRGVKVSCAAALGSVVAVRTQMVQIWTNLVSNAVKYLGDTPAPAVEIGGTDRGDVMEYWVRDNGIGIDPAYHAQVFELFQRLKEVEAEGTGVGLAIVKKIIEAAGGRVWLESAKGRGATFYFTWPKTRTA